ncbi:tetratricopeptide repeat protein [Halopiger djelfimassiliensis]|uniref:tetratricopeptide repeat protein n=1 Tax=Halopiger djelfimassiliensis TaxID=1293047 RepID=UPI0006779D88|nr:hypothetical protein [Halopiger djelfimassiliensis]
MIGEGADIETIRATLDRLETAEDTETLAAALADAIAEIDEDEQRASWVERLESLHAETETEGTAEAYGRSLAELVTIHGENGALDAIADRVDSLRQVHNEFRTEATAKHLSDGLVAEAKYQQQLETGDPGTTHSNLQFVDNVSREFPGEELFTRLAAALCWAARASYDSGDYDDVRRKANRIDGLYQQYPTDEMAYWLVEGKHPKVWIDCHNDAFETVEREIEKVEELVDEHDHSDLPNRLAHHYRNAVYVRFDADQPREADRQLDRIESFYEEYADSNGVPRYYANALRRATTYYADDGQFETATELLERLETLYENHEADSGTTKPFARALATIVEVRTGRDEHERARDRFERLREIVADEPDAVASPFGEAVDARIEAALEAGNVDEAQAILETFRNVAEESADRRLAAELRIRVALTRGEWGFDEDAYEVTVEEHDDDAVTVTVDDCFGLEHRVTVETASDGIVKTHTGTGDIPDNWNDMSPLQQVLGGRVRGFAYHWIDLEVVDVMEPHHRIRNVERAKSVVESLSTNEFETEFGTYIDQHGSHFADGTPFIDPVERPLDPTSVDIDEADIRYELWIGIEDGDLEAVSDIQIAVIEDGDREVVVEADKPDAADGLARITMEPRPLFDPEYAQDVLVEQLTRQVRDRYISYGQEPPEAVRLLGPGRYSMTSLYDQNDELPDIHDPTAEMPGYERGWTDDELRSEQLHNHIRQSFIEEARLVRDAYAAEPGLELATPETTDPDTTLEG